MARQQQDVDELCDIKNYFFIGNYQQCLNEVQKLKKPSTSEIAVERDVFMYRAYMAQRKYLLVMDEIKDNSHEKLKPLKMLSYYFHENKREEIIAELDQYLSGNVSVDNDMLMLVAAAIYTREKKLETAFRVLHGIETLETMACMLDILLKINRLDLAKKKLKEMQDKDDDATITQMAQAWVNMTIGGDKVQEAFYIYQELAEKYGPTPLLLNGQAVALMTQSKFEEAGVVLQEAFDRDPNNSDTLVNLIVHAGQTGKEASIINRYLCQLKDIRPDHPFVLELKAKEKEMEDVCAMYTFSTPSTMSL